MLPVIKAQYLRATILKMKKVLFIATVLALTVSACKNEGGITTKKTAIKKDLTLNADSEKEKFSYSLGNIIGTTLKNNGVDSVNYGLLIDGLNATLADQAAYGIGAQQARDLETKNINIDDLDNDVLLKGVYDVLEGDTTLLNLMEVNQAYGSFIESNAVRVAEANLADGKKYLETNMEREGIKVTESGLQHQLIEEGTGEAIGSNDIISVHYTGTTIEGKEFDSSVGADPYTVDMSAGPMLSPIPGFKEALSLYPVGSKYRIFIPSNLAYRDQSQGADIGPNSVLIFELENVEKVTGDEAKEFKAQQAAYLKQMEAYQKQVQQQQQQGR